MTVGNKAKKKMKILPQVHGEKCWPLVDKISPCEEACPIHMDIPSYVIALSQGKIEAAIDIVRQTNPFPSICGRVCHHPCEEACTRSLVDKPIAIEWLKRFIAQSEQSNGTPRPRMKHRKEDRVAIIGSGPAGLTTAHDLALKGYGVVVFEALPVAGGMLAAGIPDFNLPKNVVKYEVDQIKGLGVEIRTNMQIGRNISLKEIWDQGYKSVLLATGAWQSLELKIPGTDLKGVFQALSFLREVKFGEKKFLKGEVVVIGGGNVAVDAARAALRLGSEEVTLICLESRSEMPAFSWEIEKAEGEGVKILNSLAPQKIVPKLGGKVKEVAFTRVTRLSRDQEGKLEWDLASGPENEVILAADSVIVAIGQVPDPSFAQEVELGGNKTFKVDPETLATNVPGLFAAGDAVRMPGTIVEAIAAGHQAAKSINHYLKGKPLKKEKRKKSKEVFRLDEKTVLPPFLVKKDRWDMPSLTFRDAMRSFGETALGYTPEQVLEEAKRCLNCRMCGNCIFERGQLCFETSMRLL